RIFANGLPRRAFKDARRRLRRLRRAAGEVRDWDVFLEELRQRRPQEPRREQAGLDFLMGFARGRRAAAPGGPRGNGGREGKKFNPSVRETVAATRPADPQGATLLALGRPLLAGLVCDLAETAAGDLKDYAQLHRVRIACKRLRYAMEVFAGCFPPPFTDV